jgi:hypothetical protein
MIMKAPALAFFNAPVFRIGWDHLWLMPSRLGGYHRCLDIAGLRPGASRQAGCAVPLGGAAEVPGLLNVQQLVGYRSTGRIIARCPALWGVQQAM